MPLFFPSSTQTPESVLASLPSAVSPTKPHFLLFWASIDPSTGESWCPDCRRAEPLVTKYIPENQSSLIYVGQRNEWKTPENAFRKAFGLTGVPTLVKIDGSAQAQTVKGATMLVEDEIMNEEQLKKFVGV